jgi:hypothetical protein
MWYYKARVSNSLEFVSGLLLIVYGRFTETQKKLFEDWVGLGSIDGGFSSLGQQLHITLLERLTSVGVLNIDQKSLKVLHTSLPLIEN